MVGMPYTMWRPRCFTAFLMFLRSIFRPHFWRTVAFLLAFSLPFFGRAAQLIWQSGAGTPAAASYNVYYSTTDVPLQKQSTSNLFFNLDFLPSGKVYTLYVTALSADGAESGPSEQVTYAPGGGSGAPLILTSPLSDTLTVGETLSLSVSATGASPLTYQWLKNGVEIAGATATVFSISATQLGDAGNYTVRVSNSLGSAISSVAVVTLLVRP